MRDLGSTGWLEMGSRVVLKRALVLNSGLKRAFGWLWSQGGSPGWLEMGFWVARHSLVCLKNRFNEAKKEVFNTIVGIMPCFLALKELKIKCWSTIVNKIRLYTGINMAIPVSTITLNQVLSKTINNLIKSISYAILGLIRRIMLNPNNLIKSRAYTEMRGGMLDLRCAIGIFISSPHRIHQNQWLSGS